MSEFVVKIPEELEDEIREMPGMEKMLEEFIKLKAFEHELKRKRQLQRFVFEALASKSRLKQKDASELSERIEEGMLQELRDKKLI